MAEDSAFQWLQDWRAAHCDGDWEHQPGIRIDTLDNPGWRVKIPFAETELSGKMFERIVIDRTEEDWLNCWVEADTFNGACGNQNLNEVLSIFRAWACEESQPGPI